MPTSELSFPYMFWAHTDSWTAPFALTQSGMPEPDAPFLTEEFELEQAATVRVWINRPEFEDQALYFCKENGRKTTTGSGPTSSRRRRGPSSGRGSGPRAA